MQNHAKRFRIVRFPLNTFVNRGLLCAVIERPHHNGWCTARKSQGKKHEKKHIPHGDTLLWEIPCA